MWRKERLCIKKKIITAYIYFLVLYSLQTEGTEGKMYMRKKIKTKETGKHLNFLCYNTAPYSVHMPYINAI